MELDLQGGRAVCQALFVKDKFVTTREVLLSFKVLACDGTLYE